MQKVKITQQANMTCELFTNGICNTTKKLHLLAIPMNILINEKTDKKYITQ